MKKSFQMIALLAVALLGACSGGNSRLSLAALNNRDFVVRTGHFVSLLSVIGGWGGVLPPHFGQKKSRRPFFRFPARCAAVWAAGI